MQNSYCNTDSIFKSKKVVKKIFTFFIVKVYKKIYNNKAVTFFYTIIINF